MKIGFIGLGIMGEAMCANIISKHDDKVYVYDLDDKKVRKMEELGGIPCASSKELASACDVIITMVPKSEHSRAVYEGIIDELNESKTCIDMSTIDPYVSCDIAQKVMAKGALFMDAPVVKSRPAAEAGKLGIYVGGNKEGYEKILPVLSYMGENIIHMGPNGKGLVMKICHNALVSQIQNGVNETSTLALLNGIDMDTFAKAISYGGGQNFYLDSKKDVIAREDFTTAFSIANMHKDIHICLNIADKCGFKMPGEENAVRVYDKAMEEGLGSLDFSATVKVVKGK